MMKFLTKAQYEELKKDPMAFEQFCKENSKPSNTPIEVLLRDLDELLEWGKQERQKNKKLI
jgi:hypothetical protein